MSPLRRRVQEAVEDIQGAIESPGYTNRKKDEINYEGLLSTGSTLLDLSISGGRKRGGGVPGGIITEIYGPYGSGKTAILAELCASSQSRKGEALFLDPEGRLDKEYSRIYGMAIDKNNYAMPDTVEQVFKTIRDWDAPDRGSKVTHVVGVDSLAALSTDLEMDKGDKMGMRRAKDFSTELRKTARVIKKRNWLIAATNQVRDGEYGEFTPGGNAIAFYASLRMRVAQLKRIEKKVKLASGKEVAKVIGIQSHVFIKKSTVDDPFRECDIFIVFGYGIDDIRGNLQFWKDMTGDTLYETPDKKRYQSMDQAILRVEEAKLENDLRRNTIDLWEEIEQKFKTNRREKER